MRAYIKNNIKFLIAMIIVITLGIIGITYAIKFGKFNAIGLNVNTSTISANITYDSTVNEGTITSTGNMLPISDTLVDINTTDERVLKVSFNITGVNTNPDNTIYDISLRDINMDKELKSLYVKWRLYKNNTLLSEGNFSPSFDVKENNRLVLTEVQQDLTTSTDKYVYLMWISEVCTGDITTCDSTVNQNKYTNKTFNASIKIEASTKTKKELVRTKAVLGDVNEDGDADYIDVSMIYAYLNGTLTLSNQQLYNADVNADGKIDKVDALLINNNYNSDIYKNILPNEPITDYVLYGDVYEDGEVDAKDTVKIRQYLNNYTTLSYQQLKNADINADGKIDKVDELLIKRAVAKQIPNTLPDNPIKDYILYGDLNEDGEITEEDITLLSNYLETGKKRSDQSLKNADVNEDGKVNIVDLGLLQMYIESPDNFPGFTEKSHSLPNYSISKEYYTINYGDINCDGSIDVYDIQCLYEYLTGSTTLTGQKLLNADVNGDGVINSADQSALHKLL